MTQEIFRPDLRSIVATLAHNRRFTYADLEEHCYWRFPRVSCSPATLRGLRLRGLIEEVERKQYYPTPAGWDWIDTALES